MTEPTQKKKHQEHILAIPAHLANDLIPEGQDNFIGIIPVSFDEDDLFMARRAGLEKNLSFRQLISYAAVRCGNRYAVYRRAPSGGEAGLHGQVSIGFGGHSDLADVKQANSVVDLESSLKDAMEREVDEELDLNGSKIISFELLESKIVSNMNKVDSVHLGVLAIIDLDTDSAISKEAHLDFIGFHTLDEIEKMENKENWTEALVSFLKAA
jgi:predicted NUDIX family phosphoesterase